MLSLTFKWSLLYQPTGSTATLSSPSSVNPTFVVDSPGTYVAQLIVNDGNQDSAPATVSVVTQNVKPVANAGLDQTVHVGDYVILDGSGSSDAAGNMLAYQWVFTSKPNGSSAALSDPTSLRPWFRVDVPGTYVVQLTVNDGQVESDPATVTITTADSRPVAVAGPAQSVSVSSLATLNGAGSFDVDGDAITYRWTLLSTPNGSSVRLSAPTSVNPTFTPDQPGTYVVQLIVNDGQLDSPPSTVVISTAHSAPVANAGPDQEVPIDSEVTLDGGKSESMQNRGRHF